MHGSALALLPVVAAEKSKVPFFIAGGLLAVWALVVSVLLGFRKERFPGSPAGQRGVIAISLVLVAAALSTAILTSGSPTKTGEAALASRPSSGTGSGPGASSGPPSGATGPLTTTSSAPAAVATTGTPAPPSSPAAGRSSSLALAANPTGLLSYNTKRLSAKAGKVTITFTNAATLEHNVTIAQGSTVLGATPTFSGGTRTLTLTLKPGTYTFYCSVPGHRMAGMEGTLSVT